MSAHRNCARMGGAEPEQWSEADRGAMSAVRRSEKSDAASSRSDRISLFRLPEEMAAFADRGGVHGLKPSFARGGLSNGWGASVLPYHAKDFEGWPIGLDDLAPHYQAIVSVIGMAAARVMGWRISIPVCRSRRIARCRRSTQARELLGRMEAERHICETGPAFRRVASGYRIALPRLRDVPLWVPLSPDL